MNIFLAIFAFFSFFASLACADLCIEKQLFNMCQKSDESSWKNFLEKNKELLTQEVVNKKNDQGYTPLHIAISKNKLDIALFLINQGADVNAKNMVRTPLHLIIQCIPHEELENFLKAFFNACSQNIDVNIKDEEGCTPLYYYFDTFRYHQVPLKKNVIEIFIKNGADINTKNGAMQDTVLHRACTNHPKRVEILIGNGADVNAKNKMGRTPLYNASSCGFKKSVLVLLKSKKIININEKDDEEATALHIATQLGHTEVVKVLLKDPSIKVNIKNKKGDTALHLALQYDRPDIIEALLEYPHIKVNKKNNEGNTPLHVANYKGIESMQKLLKHPKIDMYAKNNRGETALDIALEKNHGHLINLFINKMGKKKLKTSYPISFKGFYKAIQTNNLKEAQNILEKKPELIEEKNDSGETLLHIASQYGRVEIVKLLALKGARVNAQDNEKEAALHKAFHPFNNFKAETLAVLLNIKDININIKDKNNQTPLHYASSCGIVQNAELLIEKGAKLNEKDQRGETPLINAIWRHNKHIAEFLILKGADINERDRHGKTPLHRAAANTSKEIVKLLIQNGANVNGKDGQGKTPLDVSNQITKSYLSKVMKNPTSFSTFPIPKFTPTPAEKQNEPDLKRDTCESSQASPRQGRNTAPPSPLPTDKKQIIISTMRASSLFLALSAAVCAWYESKEIPPSEREKSCFKRILSRKKKTIFLGLASLALFGGSF